MNSLAILFLELVPKVVANLNPIVRLSLTIFKCFIEANFIIFELPKVVIIIPTSFSVFFNNLSPIIL